MLKYMQLFRNGGFKHPETALQSALLLLALIVLTVVGGAYLASKFGPM